MTLLKLTPAPHKDESPHAFPPIWINRKVIDTVEPFSDAEYPSAQTEIVYHSGKSCCLARVVESTRDVVAMVMENQP